MSTPAISPPYSQPHARAPSYSNHTSRTPMTRPTTTLSPSAQQALSPRINRNPKTPGHTTGQKAGVPSPNYFGLTVSNSDHFSSSAAQHIRSNWSPPTSNVRSTAAASPRIIPVEQNPAFEQFRRQSENSRTFALGNFDFASPQASLAKNPFFPTLNPPHTPQSMTPSVANSEKNDTKDDAETLPVKPRSPKRMLSTESSLFPDRPRRNSPASFDGFGRTDAIAEFAQEDLSNPSLPSKKAVASSRASSRAETLPASLVDDSSTDGPTMVTAQHIINILESAIEEVLLLDLRVSTQYAKSRITGALSLCIPTTLLKRPSFDVRKLAETFKDEDQRETFERWRSSKYIIVYDASSAQLKDATTCVNTLKKFTTEGWSGSTFIIRGGFQEFSHKFPAWITHPSAQNSPTTAATAALRIDPDLPAVAPVIGGCPMPAQQSVVNPFFGNIRQNMDLIGGVGQMPVKQPASMTPAAKDDLPHWLQEAAEEKDNGKMISDSFLQIEKREQKRMQEALSDKVVYGTPTGSTPAKKIQVAGIEKGSKNRYNNIWPYEHSRVKIEGVKEGCCDYVNANHVQAAFSNKRYIATQGPIPATFQDFWNMVWQQDVRVIVMLTAEQEGGQIKAHNYWSDKRFGPLHLNPLGERRASIEPSRIQAHKEHSRPPIGQRRSTNPPRMAHYTKEPATESPNQEKPYITVRKFTLSNDDEPFQRMREITQLQYSHWPDFGAPAHPSHLLGLIEQCDAVVRSTNGNSPSKPEPSNSRPVIVHCSAGCGRTGTFCTVDSVLDMLKRQRTVRHARHVTPMDVDSEGKQKKNEREEGSWVTDDNIDLIAKTVEDFRLQRLSMVQSLRQYVLCYESVMEWLVEQHPRSA